jgi:hypothetical protein
MKNFRRRSGHWFGRGCGFLTNAFKGADAIYTMVPNNFGATNYRQYIGGIGKNYADAIQAAGVTKVVNLSSIGAHIDGGTGPISGIHDVEKAYKPVKWCSYKAFTPGIFLYQFISEYRDDKTPGLYWFKLCRYPHGAGASK